MSFNQRFAAATWAAAAMLTVSTPGVAHEMFLRADKSLQAPNTEQVIKLVNGTFDKSENPISRDRMADVSLVAGGAISKPPESAWSDDATTSYLKYRTGAPGTYVVGVSTKAKIITLPRADFITYLKHDGVLDTLAAMDKETLSSVRERYSKHVRAILQVGETRTADYGKALGYPVEILLDQNPYELKFGKEVSFRVLYQGKPLANQIVKASYDGFHGHDASGGHINAHSMRTDKNGRAKFLLSNKALWYISLIYMQRVAAADADFESNWATVTFLVR